MFLAILLTLVGGAIVVTGIVGALGELVGLYSSALNDAMAEGPEPKAVRSEMIQWAITGAAGVPFLLIGTVMLKISFFQKLLGRGKKARANADWSAPANPIATPHGTTRRDDLGESGGSKRER